jgi:hypothetical protein
VKSVRYGAGDYRVTNEAGNWYVQRIIDASGAPWAKVRTTKPWRVTLGPYDSERRVWWFHTKRDAMAWLDKREAAANAARWRF